MWWCWWHLTTLAVLQLLAVRTWPRCFLSIITELKNLDFFRDKPFCSKVCFFFTFSACNLFSENIGSSLQNGTRKACSQESGLQSFNFRNKRPKLTSLCILLWNNMLLLSFPWISQPETNIHKLYAFQMVDITQQRDSGWQNLNLAQQTLRTHQKINRLPLRIWGIKTF